MQTRFMCKEKMTNGISTFRNGGISTEKKRNNIDAITGATISGGNRAISVIEIPDDKIDAGYKIRFETAVEDQEYYPSDVEFELTTASVNGKVAGKGFIRYVRMMPQ